MLFGSINKYRVLWIVLVSALFSGCIKEENGKCGRTSSVKLKFDYTYNRYDTDRFGEELHCLLLLVYNEDGTYRESHHTYCDELEDGNTYRLDMEPGNYKFVVWGNYKEEYYGYNPGDDMESMRFWVLTHSENYVPACAPLFYGYTELEVLPGSVSDENISLVKNSNRIRVVLEYEAAGSKTRVCPGTDFSIRISGVNSTYGYDNMLAEETLDTHIIYQPTYVDAEESGKAVAEFTVLKMFYDATDRMKVIINDEVNDRNLCNLLLAEEIIHTDPDISTEEDLDKNDEYTVRFLLAYDGAWSVSGIYINDWKVSDISGGI